MSNDDYQEILDCSVQEAKDAVRDLEDPDYEAILEMEEEGKDRKTLKSFLEDRMEESEEAAEEAAEETEVEETESIEFDVASLSPSQALVGGLVIGLVIGVLVAGYGPGASQAQMQPAEVRQSVRDLVTAGGFNGTVNVEGPEVRHQMYYLNLTLTQETVNGTQTSSQAAYVSLDGELLFPVRTVLGRTVSPINLQERLAQANATR